jgi:hypothetical protein
MVVSHGDRNEVVGDVGAVVTEFSLQCRGIGWGTHCSEHQIDIEVDIVLLLGEGALREAKTFQYSCNFGRLLVEVA